METTRSKHLSIAKRALKNLYLELKGEGLLSIYLWGSILRDEYKPGISDVDALGVIDENFSEERQGFSNSFLQEHAPELYDFRINFIRLTELNGAVPKT
jgi:predicted nucleotidyltransferase